MIRNCQAQCCTGDPSSDICRDDVACAYTKEGVRRQVVTHRGMSISYIRILELSPQMENSACQQFHRELLVCSPKMRSNVFTTSAIDNIDQNPSSTTAKGSFHGTSISLLQHPFFHWRRSGQKHCNRCWI